MRAKMTSTLVVTLALAASAGGVYAADSTAGQSKLKPDTAAPADARRAVRDKETGRLRAPTDEELAAILEAERAARKARGQSEPAADPAPLVVRAHASGMRSAVLGPDFLVNLKAKRRADGKLEVTHDDPAHEHPTAKPQRPTE